jgi:hypothetical protein
MLPNPKHPLTHVQKLVYGEDGQRHWLSGYPLERGCGALSPDDQAKLLHIPEIERLEGKAIANEFRRRLGVPIPEEVEAEQARQQRAHEERLQRAYEALVEKEEAEAKKEQAEAKAQEAPEPSRPLLQNLH